MEQHWIVVQEIAGSILLKSFSFSAPPRKTQVLSNVAFGWDLYCTIATRLPFRPTTVQVSN